MDACQRRNLKAPRFEPEPIKRFYQTHVVIAREKHNIFAVYNYIGAKIVPAWRQVILFFPTLRISVPNYRMVHGRVLKSTSETIKSNRQNVFLRATARLIRMHFAAKITIGELTVIVCKIKIVDSDENN